MALMEVAERDETLPPPAAVQCVIKNHQGSSQSLPLASHIPNNFKPSTKPVDITLASQLAEARSRMIFKSGFYETFDDLKSEDDFDSDEDFYSFPVWNKREQVALQDKINPHLIDSFFLSGGKFDHKSFFPNVDPEIFERRFSSVWE